MTTITACIITKGEETLKAALQSVRDHVDEICVVFTGPDEEWSAFFAQHARLFDRAVVGKWEDDFSKTRAVSFLMARSEYIVWLDSDDIVEGAEHLRAACRPGSRIICPYHYALDPQGNVLLLQARERIVPNDGKFVWRRPVHEHLIRVDGERPVDVRDDRIVWKHQRKHDAPYSDRNLKILEQYAKGDTTPDAWLHMNLGFELQNAHRFTEALEHFRSYLALSDAQDEKALVCIRAADCELGAQDMFDPETQMRAIDWCKRAQALRPDWFEPYYAEAKVHAIPAMTHGDKGACELTLHWGRKALATPLTDTPHATRPQDRTLHIHELLRVVAEQMCDWRGALDATEAAALVKPKDAGLTLARKRYKALLSLASLEEPKTDKLDIVFACGPAAEPFDPEIYETRGVGGSETAVIEMARRLAAKGHKVRVYCLCGREGTWDGVDYYDYRGAHEGVCDVLVSWRTGRMLRWVNAKVRVIWAHDLAILGYEEDRANGITRRADRIFVLSEFHKGRFCETHGFAPEEVFVTRNGISLERFDQKVARNPHKAVYSSSPDRGLAVLLDMWPAVRERVPGAELHVFYGFDNWRAVARDYGQPMQRYLVRNLEERARNTEGVVFRGSVDQKTLAREMLSAGVWCLPTWFEETHCIGAAEAQAAGLRVISTADLGALPETVGDRGVLVEGDWLSPEYQEKFVDEIEYAMEDAWDPDPNLPAREELQTYAREHFSWDGVVDEWEIEFTRLLGDATSRGVELLHDGRPRIHVMLSSVGTGGQILDPMDPAGGSAGGGGKAGFMGLVRALGRLGKYEVTAASTFKDRFTVIDGVRYQDISEPFVTPDVAIGYYDVRVLHQLAGCLRIGLHHSLAPYPGWDYIDINTAPSPYAVEYLRRLRPRSRFEVLPNAVEGLEGIRWEPIEGRIIHHTSPDRGLYHLLERWPEIRARVPHATLHVGGNVGSIIEGYSAVALRDGFAGEMSRRLADGKKTAQEVGGVTFFGHVTRLDLLEEIRHAACFASAFEMLIPSETWSISIHECCAIGVPCVIAPADALRSLWSGVVEMTPDIQDDKGEFVDAVVRILTNPEAAEYVRKRQREHVARFSFDRMAKSVDGWVDDWMAKRKTGTRVPV
jgi:glycosyltransferase involved in cell wall biosynthesis